MKTLDVEQAILAATPAEEDLIRRLLRAKDEILKLTPGFRDDAEEFLGQLLPHNGSVLLHPEDYSDEEVVVAVRNAVHNGRIAKLFAMRWSLPYESGFRDPSYLAESPFSDAPIVDGTSWAVGEPWPDELRRKEGRPFLVLTIDIRYPKNLLLERVDERIEEAQLRLRATQRTTWCHPAKEVPKLETMLKLHSLRSKGMTLERTAEELRISPRHASRIQVELKRMLEERGYASIAPYTLFSWNSYKNRGDFSDPGSFGA